MRTKNVYFNEQDVDIVYDYQKQLDRYNLAALLLHATSALILVGLTITNDQWTVYATINRPSWKPCDENQNLQDPLRCDETKCKITSTTDVSGKFPIEWLVFTFHMLSVVAHALNRFTLRDTYFYWLSRKMNPGRWLEYFFSASVMQSVIMILTGFFDVWTLSFSTVLIAVTQIFGHATEQYLWRSRFVQLTFLDKWQFFFYGWVSFLPPWISIYYTFYWAVLHADGSKPPDWVQGIVWSLLVVFVSFAFVMIYYLRNHANANVSYVSEKWYCILSLVSKTILTWQLYFGALSRSKNDLVAYDPRNATLC